MDVTIVIPTHDRAAVLGAALGALRKIRIPPSAEVEAVVVANACTDHTADTVRRAATDYPFPLRLLEEPSPGLNTARNRGMEAARGGILAYLDDDAFVEPGWLEGLLGTFAAVPADLLAGRVVLGWEDAVRPTWTSEAVERLLSRLDLGDEVMELPSPRQLVGANFAVRRSVAVQLGGFVDGLDRVGADLLSGGDTELAMRARKRGFRLFYAPDMAVRHRVAPERLARSYLDRVARARGRTRVALLRSTGELRPATLLRHGLAQVVYSGFQEVRHSLAGDRGRAVASRLARQRAAGTVGAVLRGMVGRRTGSAT